MKFTSFSRLFGGDWRRTKAGKSRRLHGQRGSKLTASARLSIERLEDRTLLTATLPTPVANPLGVISKTTATGRPINLSSPSIAQDPTNPLNLVAAYTRNDPTIAGVQKVFIDAQYSFDGGVTWTNLPPPLNYTDPSSGPVPRQPFVQATDATVSWDRNHNFYIVYSEHSVANDIGAIVLQKYTLTGGTPMFQRGADPIEGNSYFNRLYTWGFLGTGSDGIGNDAGLNPTLAVDNSFVDPNTGQPIYHDPITGATQQDLSAGTIYVAFNTNYKLPHSAIPNPNSFNPNTIKIMASFDQGATFTTPKIVNSTGFATGQRLAAPSITVSQGTSSDRPLAFGQVKPGQLSLVWSDFGATTVPNPNPDPFVPGGTNGRMIRSNAIPDGGVGTSAIGMSGMYDLAMHPPMGDDIPVTTTFDAAPVTFDPTLGGITGINVKVAIEDKNIKEIRLVLVSPTGTMYTLMQNNVDAGGRVRDMGDQNNPIGVTGTPAPAGMQDGNLGYVEGPMGQNALPWDTVFDPEAPRRINDRQNAAPYSGYHNAEGNLPRTFTLAQATGVWQLQITSFRAHDMEMPPPVHFLRRWSITFTQKLKTFQDAGGNPDSYVSGLALQGAASPTLPGYPDKANVYPSRGLGPTPSIASDNTLGSFSPYQGRLYVTFTGPKVRTATAAIGDSTDIYLAESDDGGMTWNLRSDSFGLLPSPVNDDAPVTTDNILPSWDGFSEGNRPHFQASVAVDQATGTVVVTYRDGRYDAAHRRVVTTLVTSIDGGRDFQNGAKSQGGQIYLNAPQTAGNAVTGQNVNVQPIPDNESAGNADNDAVFGFGDHMSLVVSQGQVYTIWSGNMNGDPGTLNAGGTANRNRLKIFATSVALPAGPRVIGSTMGPVSKMSETLLDDGATLLPYNSTFTTDGVEQVDGFTVTFDRPIADGRRSFIGTSHGQATITPADIFLIFHDTVTPQSQIGTTIPILSVTPVFDYDPKLSTFSFGPVPQGLQLLRQQYFGANKFLIRFAPQRQTGTYSYSIGPVSPAIPGPKDLIRAINGDPNGVGNTMDQNANGFPGEFPGGGSGGDTYATPSPVNNASNFFAPYVQTTLPIIIPGPHIVNTFVNGNPITPDNLVLNNTVSGIDIVFDRDMDPSTITPDAILRMIGPAGQIKGPFTITADPFSNYQRSINGNVTTGADPDPTHPRTYRISFPPQQVSGTYTLNLAPTVRSAGGDLLDTNQNAGVDILRDNPTGGTSAVSFPNTTGVQIQPQTSVTSRLTVNSNFVIQGLTLTLNISYFFDPDLSAYLVAPDGTIIQLFNNVGLRGTSFRDFTNTIFDDNASLPSGDTNPIQNASAPFNGRFNPQQPLSVLVGKQAAGTYQLVITSKSSNTTSADRLNNWTLTFQRAQAKSGLGEAVADQATISFRIFNLDKSNPVSQKIWTAVGPASIGTIDPVSGQVLSPNSHSSRIAGIAVDPSDPSGNTAFVAGASGGVWKTTNFLTTDPRGPTYVPLTDTAPTLGLNIGSIAVFGRNNNTNQSIVFVATGEGDTGSAGVGILRSTDGGQTWTLLDSTDNTKPFASRDHKFDGNTAFKVAVDPTANPFGQVILYVAFSGRNGGIWRSSDTGNTWTLARAGQATDVVLAAGSADANSGNLRIVYGAFQGEGVFRNDDLGARWNLMTGGLGVLYADPTFTPPQYTTVNNGTITPNGAKGRISLAAPALVPSTAPNARIENLLYQGWLYAIVSTPAGRTDGLYVTKDFGANWTKIKITHSRPPAGRVGPVQPTNDETAVDLDLLGSAGAPQGNYNQAVVVDPNNPNVVYVGGTADFNPTALIRVDTTGIADASALLPYNNFRNDGTGALEPNTTGPAQLSGDLNGPAGLLDPTQSPFHALYNQPHWLNLVKDPFQPFLSNSTLQVANLGMNAGARIPTLTNDGAQIKWVFYDTAIDGNTDLHRMVAIPDPLTGKTRLIFGLDQGIFSVVDPGDGTTNFSTGIGTDLLPADPSRNGNLQINQFYGGASQPSQLAANIAGALLYGEAQDNGFPVSDPNLLTNGNISWNGPTGDGQWVGADQTGQGGVYEYRWPCCQGGEGQFPVDTDFFRFDPNSKLSVSRTNGLFLNPPPDQANWPNTGGFNAAINPINGQQLVLSSRLGNVFRTENGGFFWSQIGAATDLDSSNAQALAYGAPDPQDPTGLRDNFIWAGTVNGHVFVTLDGGRWNPVSTGLDGSPVQFIAANPNRGTHEAYAVTSLGVYHLTFNVQLDPTLKRLVILGTPTWENITGNLFQVSHISFGDVTLLENQLKNLTSLAADWRFSILDDPSNPQSATHPVLYVGGDSGVYRSQDKGKTWALFPSAANDGAPVDGGYLPNVKITHLDLVLGNINPETGLPSRSTSPDMLLATTYGRGSFAIHLAPPKPIQEVFVIGLDNRVYAQRLDSEGNPVGGYFNTSASVVKAIATGHDGEGRPLVFALGLDNQVYIQHFDVNGNVASDFAATAPGQVKSIAATTDGTGNPELFVIGLNDNVFALNFDANANPLGSYFLVEQGAVKSLVVSHDVQNRPELFVLGLDNQIYARRLDASGHPVVGESYFLTQAGQVQSFDVGQDSAGRPIVYAIGQDNQVYAQRLDNNGQNAAPWYLVVQGFNQVKGLTVGHDANNSPLLFVTGLNDAIFYAALAPDANGNFVSGTYLATAPGSVKNYKISYDANNIPEIFATGLDDQIYEQQFTAPGKPIGFYRLMDAGRVLALRPTPDTKIQNNS